MTPNLTLCETDEQNVNMAVEVLCLGRRQNRALWLEGFPARVGHKLQFFPKIRETHNIMTTAHFSTLLHMLYFFMGNDIKKYTGLRVKIFAFLLR